MSMVINMFVDPLLIQLARLAGWRVFATIAASVAAAGASVAAAFAIAAVVRHLLTVEAPLAETMPALSLAALAVAARAGLLWLRDIAAISASNHVKADLRARLLRHALDLGVAHRFSRGAGGVQASIVDGVEHLQAWVGFYLPQLAAAIIIPGCLVGILLTRDVGVALIVAIGVAIVPLAQRAWSRVLGERASAHWDAYERFAARISDTLRGMETLVALHATARQGRTLRADAEELRLATTANLRSSLAVSAITAGAMSVGTAGATLLAAYHAATGRLGAGDVILVLFLAAECFRPLQELQNYWHEGFHGQAAARGLAQLQAQRPLVTDARASDATWPAAPAITCRGVGYTYPGARTAALKDVSFTLPGGSTLAIVGPSGSGKSTLASLLLRDIDPDSGEILIAGRPLPSYRLAEVRRGSALVAQQIVLLDGSIRDNVLAADSHASEERLAAAVAAARVDEVTARLPGGLDAPVGERGALLSGGERQRVALARALLAGASVMVLDEATSALDTMNEALITEALRTARGSCTTIVIAHRLSTVIGADYVLVLDEGRISQFGPPADLARVPGPWADMLAAHQPIGDRP